MLSKTKLLSYLLTSIWAYFGGFLLWGLLGETLLNDHLGSASGVMREMPDHFHLALGCVILAITFSIIYAKWAQGKHSVSQGLSFGILVGILTGLGSGMIDFSTSNLLTFSGFIINALIYIVYYVVMGILVGFIYSKSK
ncbi:hypothetical protein OE09_0453 [Flavobacteriaceae bacterium MAR_2010_72]|nr:hypothetical protein OE09_0453 [Flavobacteriaceae bacterium MAR_2010_72]TVZ57895.1 hypothetical protein NA63_0385 [Flavobacteriaceae bacterium MAR_2010_105]